MISLFTRENLPKSHTFLPKTGAAYLPVDSHSAINRVRYTLHEAAPLCVIVDAQSEFKCDTDTVWSCFLLLDLDELLAEAASGDVRYAISTVNKPDWIS